ncbi:MAG: ATP-binding protein [Acidiferrobacterales bacterium]|nr:ATP-binding protein [Acidiferrobacterales bacterium]
MLAAISHDLRTPITRLRLRSELIDDAGYRQKTLSDLDEMEAMISTVLSFAREDADNEASETIDLASTLQTICDNTAELGHEVELVADTRIPYVCRPVSIRRCFSNLIENAVKYGKRARVSVTTDSAAVVIRIEDSGPGIPEHLQNKVFDAFFRIERSRNRETGGVGLGLTVARTILHAHGGRIKLENREHGGLLATVTLPYSKSDLHGEARLDGKTQKSATDSWS